MLWLDVADCGPSGVACFIDLSLPGTTRSGGQCDLRGGKRLTCFDCAPSSRYDFPLGDVG